MSLKKQGASPKQFFMGSWQIDLIWISNFGPKIIKRSGECRRYHFKIIFGNYLNRNSRERSEELLYALSKPISIRCCEGRKDLTTNWSLVASNLNNRLQQSQDSFSSFPTTAVHTNSFRFPFNRSARFQITFAVRKIIIQNQVRIQLLFIYFFEKMKKEASFSLTIKIVQHFSPEKIPSTHFKFHERESWSSSILLHYINCFSRRVAFFALPEEKLS